MEGDDDPDAGRHSCGRRTGDLGSRELLQELRLFCEEWLDLRASMERDPQHIARTQYRALVEHTPLISLPDLCFHIRQICPDIALDRWPRDLQALAERELGTRAALTAQQVRSLTNPSRDEHQPRCSITGVNLQSIPRGFGGLEPLYSDERLRRGMQGEEGLHFLQHEHRMGLADEMAVYLWLHFLPNRRIPNLEMDAVMRLLLHTIPHTMPQDPPGAQQVGLQVRCIIGALSGAHVRALHGALHDAFGAHADLCRFVTKAADRGKDMYAKRVSRRRRAMPEHEGGGASASESGSPGPAPHSGDDGDERGGHVASSLAQGDPQAVAAPDLLSLQQQQQQQQASVSVPPPTGGSGGALGGQHAGGQAPVPINATAQAGMFDTDDPGGCFVTCALYEHVLSSTEPHVAAAATATNDTIQPAQAPQQGGQVQPQPQLQPQPPDPFQMPSDTSVGATTQPAPTRSLRQDEARLPPLSDDRFSQIGSSELTAQGDPEAVMALNLPSPPRMPPQQQQLRQQQQQESPSMQPPAGGQHISGDAPVPINPTAQAGMFDTSDPARPFLTPTHFEHGLGSVQPGLPVATATNDSGNDIGQPTQAPQREEQAQPQQPDPFQMPSDNSVGATTHASVPGSLRQDGARVHPLSANLCSQLLDLSSPSRTPPQPQQQQADVPVPPPTGGSSALGGQHVGGQAPVPIDATAQAPVFDMGGLADSDDGADLPLSDSQFWDTLFSLSPDPHARSPFGEHPPGDGGSSTHHASPDSWGDDEPDTKRPKRGPDDRDNYGGGGSSSAH